MDIRQMADDRLEMLQHLAVDLAEAARRLSDAVHHEVGIEGAADAIVTMAQEARDLARASCAMLRHIADSV